MILGNINHKPPHAGIQAEDGAVKKCDQSEHVRLITADDK